MTSLTVGVLMKSHSRNSVGRTFSTDRLLVCRQKNAGQKYEKPSRAANRLVLYLSGVSNLEMQTLDEYLKEAERNHGHMCPGQILGVRMAMAGCVRIGIEDPKSSRRLIVFVEIDRCAADAINTVTGCRLGKRTLKFRDYGKLAATFYNTDTQRAVRVVAVETSRNVATERYSHLSTRKEQQMAAYRELPDDELFRFQEVAVELTDSDLPGHPLKRVVCERCTEGINDNREVVDNGRILCRSCAGAGYYRIIE